MDMNGILIGSENAERLKDYYTKLFGKPGWDDGGFYGWQLGNGWITIGAHDQVKGKNPDPGRVIWNIVTPDVKGEFEKLKAAGATVVKAPYNPGGPAESGGQEMLIATFSDPDNNYFQLMSPMA
jgi:predicted enzyme related to lactoylglutathione lyase